MHPTVLTPKEAAELLHTTTNALANQRWRGIGPPYIKAGKRIYYLLDDVNGWLDDHRVKTVA